MDGGPNLEEYQLRLTIPPAFGFSASLSGNPLVFLSFSAGCSGLFSHCVITFSNRIFSVPPSPRWENNIVETYHGPCFLNFDELS